MRAQPSVKQIIRIPAKFYFCPFDLKYDIKLRSELSSEPSVDDGAENVLEKVNENQAHYS